MGPKSEFFFKKQKQFLAIKNQNDVIYGCLTV